MIEISLILVILSFIPPTYLILSSKLSHRLEPNISDGDMPEFSIILPVRNESSNIERKIDELILLFEGKADKLIIIDSNSEDRTHVIAKNILKSRNPNMKWEVICTEKIGKSKAINHILDIIKTPWFIMFDADASIEKSSVKYLINWMQDSTCGAVCGAHKNIDDNSSYRKRFNLIRTYESYNDSSTIFEGSFCAIRLAALKGDKLIETINADDTQFALMVKRNGYRAIFESRAVFYDQEPTKYWSKIKRNVRRSQGLIRVFWTNKDMASIKDKFGRSLLHSIYFYIIFPWFFILSYTLLIFDLIFMNSYFYFSVPLLIIIFSFFAILNFNFVKNFFNGIISLILAQISLILGLKYNSWTPER